MSRYVIATTKSWNIENTKKLIKNNPQEEIFLITEKSELTKAFLDDYRPRYVFFPHWSWIIPEEVYSNYQCVVFHMTDLPFGRGGSPLQNLLVRGIYKSKISAIRVDSGVDTGPVYFKEPVDISEGNANQIFINISGIVFGKMIPKLMNETIVPVPQEGEVLSFKRRKPEQSEIPEGLSQRQIYDYIRMLDGEGYPTAFKKYDNGRMFFYDAVFDDGIVTAKVRFMENETI